MSRPTLFDSHSHFDDTSFDADRDASYARAQAVGVTRQIIAGVSAALWPRLRQICAHYANLYPSYGLHPYYLSNHKDGDTVLLSKWIAQEKPVAVGEIGLDYFTEELSPIRQAELFTAQLRLAREAELPVIIHARRAVEDVIKHLRKTPGVYGMVHSFSGSLQQADRLMEMGFYLSFGGPITYPGAKRLHKLVQTLPLERLLLETDAPDQPLSNHRGRRNEPARLVEVLSAIAELRQEEPAHIAKTTTFNTMKLFNIPDE